MGRIKDFLKSDWRKVVIFIIIYLFFPYPVFMFVETTIEPSLTGWYFFPFAAPLMFWGSILGLLHGLKFYSSLDYITCFIGLFFPIIVYFFSCLIIFIYENIKKKKKQK